MNEGGRLRFFAVSISPVAQLHIGAYNRMRNSHTIIEIIIGCLSIISGLGDSGAARGRNVHWRISTVIRVPNIGILFKFLVLEY